MGEKNSEKLREEARLLLRGLQCVCVCVTECVFRHLLQCLKKKGGLMKAGQDSFCMES